MATNKQCKMLLARASEAGMPLKWEDCEDLANGEVDEMIERIKAYKKPAEKTELPAKTEQKEQFNGQRFGMCYKIITDAVGQEYKRLHPDVFCELVAQEYELATKAEAKASASMEAD